jgi:tRNA dimethylallyltransferase
MDRPSGKVILLVGPTCVGKTAVSILLAEELDTEIISADSMQIYRHMDIGTEKPTPGQRKKVRHHMIDIVEPSEDYSAGRYVEAVRPVIEGLHRKGKMPVVTGGTGLYIKAMTRGLFRGPSADWALREKLQMESTDALYRRLASLDPEAAREIMPTDKRRVVRALEVCHLSGEKFSELKRKHTVSLPYEFIKIALSRDRKELYAMIEKRVDGMFQRGLVEEVENLIKMNPSRTPMQAIGYKEVAAHLSGECSLDEAMRLIKRSTKRFAKRQFTWFGKEEGLNWADVTGLREAKAALTRIWLILKASGL